MFSNVFILLLMILNKREKIENWAKIRGWDVFSVVFKKMDNFSLNVFINIVFIKKKNVYSKATQRKKQECIQHMTIEHCDGKYAQNVKPTPLRLFD